MSWFQRIKEGLRKSSSRLASGITDIFTKRKLDDAAVEELEDLLVMADLGPATAAKLAAAIAKERFDKAVDPDEIRGALADEVAAILDPVAKPLMTESGAERHVVRGAGVNGSGKTTTIGKFAKHLQAEGKTVMLAAGDTFRAAAIEQLKVWGDRTGASVVAKEQGADAAGLAFDAIERARREGVDVLLIDTAGRLHNKSGLMEELKKIVRVIRKMDENAPHDVLLVLDATTGQNAIAQVETFKEMVNVTGLVVTKLDGTAKGGVLVALAERFGLPVHAIGVGEQADDLRPFAARDFARGLMGLED